MEFIAVLIIAAAIIALQTHIYSEYWSKGLEYRCYFTDSELFEGSETELVEEISNRKRLPLPWLKSEFSIPSEIDIIGANTVIADDTRFFSGYFFLKGCSKVIRRRRVKLLKRGVYTVHSVVLVASDILGTLCLSMPAEKDCISSQITVLPLRAEIDDDAEMCGGFGERELFRLSFPDPCTVNGVREYEYTDGARQINRSATASHGRLMSSQYANTASGRALILLDPSMASPDDTEQCIRLAAALFEKCRLCGIEFALAANGGNGSFSGYGTAAAHEYDLLRRLAALDTSAAVSSESFLFPLISGSSILASSADTHIFLITARKSSAEDLIESMYCKGTDITAIAPQQ